MDLGTQETSCPCSCSSARWLPQVPTGDDLHWMSSSNAARSRADRLVRTVSSFPYGLLHRAELGKLLIMISAVPKWHPREPDGRSCMPFMTWHLKSINDVTSAMNYCSDREHRYTSVWKDCQNHTVKELAGWARLEIQYVTPSQGLGLSKVGRWMNKSTLKR